MKQKTNKLRQLESKRYSIMTDDLNHCYFCRSGGCLDIHEIYGGANRKMSMVHGFCVPICRNCHTRITNDAVMSQSLKADCQTIYELTHTRSEFMKIIGRNYK